MYEFGEAEAAAVNRVLSSRVLYRYMDEAHEVGAFETEFAAVMGAGHALMTGSGTAALISGLAALGVGPGDEVLIPAYGFVADVLAVLAVGAVPVVCDVDDGLGMDAAAAAEKITGRTRAVMPVHMCGFSTDMDPLLALAAAHDLAVVEDACQAIGGSYRGRRLGTLGSVGAFSFHQAKILTAGEGGALVTGDPVLYERAIIAHDPSCVFDGQRFKQATFGGFPFRASEITGAIMRVQLTRMDGILSRLRESRDRMHEALGTLGGLRRMREHDPAGSCGSFLGYQFDAPEAAIRFLDIVNEIGREAEPPIWAMRGNSLGHSFFEWDLLHERRGAHHPGRDPLAGTTWRQGPDTLPRSLDILGRTVLVGFGTRMDAAVVERLHTALASVFG